MSKKVQSAWDTMRAFLNGTVLIGMIVNLVADILIPITRNLFFVWPAAAAASIVLLLVFIGQPLVIRKQEGEWAKEQQASM